ncbi:hypothetical protein Y1Q_0007338 [Alligator mississippiensis]|uniref:Uncharacterized protein n=1 Tax=Alligator mississippiensis TaxID=8496 RepID=A0A151P7G4_ALLMI|nr:hypothetical protein Y1Q_0007338 [Alligator mississippiensis]
MKLHRSCWSFCPIFLLVGFSQPVCIELHQDAINGTIGESVLLPVSYRLQIPFHNPLPFSWNFINIPHILSLQLNDSGVYSVIFMGGKQSRNITLTVSVPRLDNRSPESNISSEDTAVLPSYQIGIIAGGSVGLLFLVLPLFCYKSYRGAVQLQKNQTVRQEQVQNPEECNMGSSLNIQSIYMNFNTSQEYTVTRTEPQTKYEFEKLWTNVEGECKSCKLTPPPFKLFLPKDADLLLGITQEKPGGVCSAVAVFPICCRTCRDL